MAEREIPYLATGRGRGHTFVFICHVRGRTVRYPGSKDWTRMIPPSAMTFAFHSTHRPRLDFTLSLLCSPLSHVSLLPA